MVWIEHVWRDWLTDGGSHETLDTRRGARQYAHWRFAEQLATKNADDIERGVVMQKLWNAVDGRVRLLFETYQLRNLVRTVDWTGKGRPDRLEVLVRLGLLRPLALRELKDIRNAVEHADQEPPGIDRAANLVDLVWYFLRSTDVHVSRRVTDIVVVLEDEQHVHDPIAYGTYSVSVRYPLDTWLPTISARLRSAEISTEERANFLAVALTEPLSGDGEVVRLSGTIRPNGDAFEHFIRAYFVHELVNPE